MKGCIGTGCSHALIGCWAQQPTEDTQDDPVKLRVPCGGARRGGSSQDGGQVGMLPVARLLGQACSGGRLPLGGKAASLLMLALVVICYVRSPSSGLAIAQASSLLVLQGASQPLVALSLLTVTAFAPRLTVRESPPSFGEVPSSVVGRRS